MADHTHDGEDWHNGICSHVCGGDCGTCWAAWCCSCFLFGRTAQRMKYFPSTNKDQFELFNGNCALYCLSGYIGMNWIPQMLKRGEFRDSHSIKGNACTDCLVSCFCMPCGLAQMETEAKQRAEMAQVNGGYQSNQQQMVYGNGNGNGEQKLPV